MSIRITKPNAGERVRVAMPAQTEAQNVSIGFSTDGANVERVGNDLVFRFEDGSETRVTNFFVTGGRPLPNFVLEDGTEVSSADVLRGLNSAMDLETAAGPGASSSASGGSGEYADDSGSLLDGVNRLGAHGRLGDWGYGGEEGLEATSEGAQNLGLINIYGTMFPMDENMFAPGNVWAAPGTSLLAGQVFATDPEGAPILFTLVPAVQTASVVTDDGSVLTLGTYRIDPVTGELYIDLVDHSSSTIAEKTAAETLANSLKAGSEYTLSPAQVTMTDGANFSTITVNPVASGINDDPVMVVPAPQNFTEAGYEAAMGSNTLSGTLVATDADHGETAQLVYSVAGTITCASTNNSAANSSPSISDYGTFTLDPDTGAWTFVSGGATNDTRISNLREGEIVQITIPVKVTDPQGADSVTQNIVITIVGTNDRPLMTTPTANIQFSVTENAIEGAGYPYTNISGTLTFTDEDLGDTHTFGSGTATCSTDNGANVSPSASDYGDFTLNASTGAWSFTPTSPAQQAAIDELRHGEQLVITIPVYVTDNSGAADAQSVAQNIVITITGSNDRPVMTTPAANLEFSLTENAIETAGYPYTAINGSLTFTETDLGDTHTFGSGAATCSTDNGANVSPNASDYGDFTLNASTGAWSFTPTSPAQQAAIDELRHGEQLVITIPVYVTDNSGAADAQSVAQNIVITITGSNDRPLLSAATYTQSGTPGGTFGGSVASNVSDVDLGDTHTFQIDSGVSITFNGVNVSAADAGFVLNANGTWSVDATKALYYGVGAGNTGTLVVTYNAKDNSGEAATDTSTSNTLTITVLGTNNGPVIGGVFPSPIVEDDLVLAAGSAWNSSAAITIGTVSATDDPGDTLTYSITSGATAKITLSDGYAYEIGTYSINSSTGVITLTLNAALAGQNSKTPAEIIAMIDSLKGGVGANSAALSGVTVSVTDGVSSDSYVYNPNVAGVNDSPIVQDVVRAMTEDTIINGDLRTSGYVSDPDSAIADTTFEVGTVTYGGVTIGFVDLADLKAKTGIEWNETTGEWKIDGTNGLYQSLGAGQTATLEITYRAKDDSGVASTQYSNDGKITVTVTGTNDGGRIVGDTTGSLTEPDTVNWWGTSGGVTTATNPNGLSNKSTNVDLEFTDADAGETLTVTITCGGNSITFAVNGDGTITDAGVLAGTTVVAGTWGQLSYDDTSTSWVYTAYNKTDALKAGETKTDTFSMSAQDSGGGAPASHTLNVTVTGVDDGPTVFDQKITHDQASQILGPYLDDAAKTDTLTGTLNLMDVDDADSTLCFKVLLKDPVSGNYVEVTMDPMNNNVFELEYGTLTIKWQAGGTDAIDGVGGVTGADTGAWVYEYKFDYTGNAPINQALAENIKIQAYDPDLPSNLVDLDFKVNIITNQYDSDMPKPRYDVLTFDLDTVDPILGTEPYITFGGAGNNSPDRYEPGNDNVLDNDRTINNTDAAWWDGSNWVLAPNVGINVSGAINTEYGTLTFNADGTFTFAPDLTHLNIKALGAGETLSISIPYTMMEDGKAFQSYLVVEFKGTNDAPEGRNLQLNVTHGFGDNDGIVDIAGALGTDVDGDSLSYTFFSDDGLNTPLTGSNSAQSVFNPADFGLGADYVFDPNNEGLAPGTQFTQDLTGYDNVYAFEYGWLCENTDGSFEFVVNKNHPDVIKLKGNESILQEITYEVDDNKGGTATGSIKVTITGDYDKLAVKSLDTNLSAHFTKVDTDSDGIADAAVYYQGFQNQTTFDPSGAPVIIDGMNGAGNPELHSAQTYSWAQTIFSITKSNLADSLDGDPSRYSLSVNSSTLYVRDWDADTGTWVYTRVGTLGVTANVSLFFQPLTNDEMGKLSGEYTEFFVNTSGTPFELYATSSDDASGTKTPIDLNFSMVFADDSPIVVGCRAEVQTGTAMGQVVYTDIDTKAEDLRLWVTDENGDLKEIDVDGTVINYPHGDLTINMDGTFTYVSNGTDDGNNHNIRVVVDDGVSAGQNVITIDNVGVQQMATIVDDQRGLVFSIDPKKYQVVNVLTNDAGYDATKGVLNGGEYELSNLVIREEGATGSASLSGSEADPLFTIAAGSRFSELKFANCSVTLTTNGELYIHTSAGAPITFYDEVSGATFSIQMSTADIGFKTIADYLTSYNLSQGDLTVVTAQDVKNALNFQVEYQVQDAVTGELITGTADLNVGGAYELAGQYRQGGTGGSFSQSMKVSSAMDTTSSDATMEAAATSVYLTRDNNGGDTAFRVNTWSLDGTQTTGGYTAVRDFVGSDMGTSGGSTIYTGTDTVSVPMYTWYNTVTGAISGTKGSGSDWVCVQIGEADVKFTTLGVYSQVGTAADGTPIYSYGTNTVYGNVVRDFYSEDDIAAILGIPTSDPDYPTYLAAFKAFYQSMRDLAEGQESHTVFVGMEFSDATAAGGWADGTGTTGGGAGWVITITGSDVVLGDGNDTVNLSTGESAAVAGTTVVDILAGAKHTFVNGTDSTSRTDVDGWDRFEFSQGGGQTGSASADGHTISGTYGELIWNATTGKYTYQIYSDSRGDAARQLVDGQTLQETFNYTVYDKNGESDAGVTVLTIEGKSDGFSITLPGGPATVTEGTILDVTDVADIFTTQDGGVMKYYIQYTDPESGMVIDTYLTPSGGDMEVIYTPWGQLSFSPSTGVYSFNPNGALQEGDTATLDIKVKAEVTSSNGAKQDSVWVDYDLVITGVNDAPVMPENSHLSAADSTQPSIGAVAWSDVDNDLDAQAGKFTLDAWHTGTGDAGTTTSGIEEVQGDYGTLYLNTTSGSYEYDLDTSVFSSTVHRVVDEFGIKVQDPGKNPDAVDGTEKWSEDATLTIYGVDGGYAAGTSGNDALNTFNDGKAHLIYGGAGNDTINLAGSSGENILIWREGDAGAAGAPAVDIIQNFTVGNLTDADPNNDGDFLDLRGLLSDLLSQGSGKVAGDLISFEVSGGTTTINISSAADTTQTVQQIVLQGTALTANDLSNGTYEELAQQIMLITQ